MPPFTLASAVSRAATRQRIPMTKINFTKTGITDPGYNVCPKTQHAKSKVIMIAVFISDFLLGGVTPCCVGPQLHLELMPDGLPGRGERKTGHIPPRAPC